MVFFRKYRLRKIEITLAGLRAKLTASQKLADQAQSIPGGIVIDLQNIPQRIAELEKLKEQLAG